MNEFGYNEKHFRFIQKTVYNESGIRLSNEKQSMVYSRLTRRLRELDLTSFDEYCGRLGHDTSEAMRMIEAITTNVTHFFREQHHFDFIEKVIVPEKHNNREHELAIWSAGCSSGQEPYSLAMTLTGIASIKQWQLQILASDLNSEVLSNAQKGIYPYDFVKELPKPVLKRCCLKSKKDSTKPAQIKIKPEVAKLIQFQQINLLHKFNALPNFDVIFCRNVMIYFDKDTQSKLVHKFAEKLNPNGYLFIGHSENIMGLTNTFELIGNTIYRKVS